MPRICHITTVHDPQDNRILYKECVGLAAVGYDVVLIAPSARPKRVSGVEIVPIGPWRSRIIRMTVGAIQAGRTALRQQAEIYHFHDPELIPVALALRCLGKKVVYDIHEDYVTSIQQKPYLPRSISSGVAAIVGAVESLAARAFYQVIAEKYYRRRFPEAVEVLNYPIQKKSAERRGTSGAALAQVCASSRDAIKILYTGGVTLDRGALNHAAIVNSNDRAEVHFVGRCGPDVAEEIYKIAGDNRARVRINGINRHVPFEEIVEVYEQHQWTAGVAIFPDTPHYREKELTKFFEYMAYGLPIICSDFPVWKALVDESGCGITVRPDCSEEIAAAVQRLADDVSLRNRMAANGQRAVKERYSWDTQLKQLARLYERISTGSPFG